jgi:hypothetical protein
MTVGITGHRNLTPHVTQMVQKTCERILAKVAAAACGVRERSHPAYATEVPVVRLLSPLADGTDRAAAKALLALEAPDVRRELFAVLPFSPADYRRDFSGADDQADEASVSEFDELLRRAGDRVMVLAGARGSRDDRLRAYEAAGRFVIDHSDLLIAVLDDERTQHRGGTAQIFGEALRAGIPVIWIHPDRPETPSIQVDPSSTLRPILSMDEVEEVARLVLELGTYHDPHRPVRSDLLEEFLAEKPPSRIGRAIYQTPWQLLMSVSAVWRGAGGKARGARRRPALLARGSTKPVPQRQSLPDPFRPIYRHVQGLAVHYAVLYRGAFLFNYVLGALAVTCALLSYADRARGALWSLIEIGLIGTLLVNFALEHLLTWRRKLVDYRFLAEEFRQMRVLHAIGMVPPAARPVILRTSGHPGNTWMDRYFRAVVRAVGPPQGRIDVDAWQSVVRERWVGGQIRYHDDQARKLEGAERMLLHLCTGCFVLAGFGGAAHLLFHAPKVAPWLTVFAAGMPAWAAAFHAISVQAEFSRLVQRSEEVRDQLGESARRLEALKGPSITYGVLRSETLIVAQLMLDEVTDWRIVYSGPRFIPA